MRSASYHGHGSDDPDDLSWQTRFGPPENEVPYAVPLTAVLARTDDAAIALTGVQAYTTGVSLALSIRLRVLPAGVHHMDLHGMLDGWGGRRGQQLLLGVEYADGRRGSNLGGFPGDVPDDQPVLSGGGGGGGGRTWDQSYWLSPVPPDGPLTFVCSWGALGVPETQHVLETADLTSAAARATVLWPWEPEPEEAPPSEPDLPTGGWFGRALQAPEVDG